MEVWLKLIKPMLDSTLGKGVDIVPVPVRCFIVKIMDFALLQHQKWHEGCFATVQWSKLSIASLCEGENLRLYSPRVD